MNILILTNTYTPHVGGVARSVQTLRTGLRERGHRVLVVAPVFEHQPDNEDDVIRVSAIQRFRGSDFSLPVPVVPKLASVLTHFQPDIVHSHHPFLLGDVALRIAAARCLPIVFTYHTRYELYSHYVLSGSTRFEQLVISLSTGYCNLCDGVIAPSTSIRTLLHERQVDVPVEVIPTGIPTEKLSAGDGQLARKRLGIAGDAFVVGHLGRLAPEKNIIFLARTLAAYLATDQHAVCLMCGEGPVRDEVENIFQSAGLEDRLYLQGHVDSTALADTYSAMDVFAFASLSETQGLVLVEAMAAGVPIVAIEAPGASDVVRDGVNGRLICEASGEDFVRALGEIATLDAAGRARIRLAAQQTAEEYSVHNMIDHTLRFYGQLQAQQVRRRDIDASAWTTARRSLGKEWHVLRNLVQAVGDAVVLPDNSNL